jgi:hypothetical protein
MCQVLSIALASTGGSQLKRFNQEYQRRRNSLVFLQAPEFKHNAGRPLFLARHPAPGPGHRRTGSSADIYRGTGKPGNIPFAGHG